MSAPQHPQMSAGYWELHLLPQQEWRDEKSSEEGEEREIKEINNFGHIF